MSQSSAELSQQLSRLSDRFNTLGDQLLAAARELQAPGLPPSGELFDGITSCRQEFLDLRDRAIGLAASAEVPTPPAEEVQSLQDLAGMITGIADTESRKSAAEELRAAAIAVIDRVLLVAHTSTPDFAPLVDCHESARELGRALAEGPWSSLPGEAAALASGEHPLAQFVALVADRDALDDDQWATLHDSVGRHFGKPLAAAAARAKLVIGADDAGDADAGAPSGMAYAEEQ